MPLELLSLPQPALETLAPGAAGPVRPGARFHLLQVTEDGTLEHYEFWLPDQDFVVESKVKVDAVMEAFRRMNIQPESHRQQAHASGSALPWGRGKLCEEEVVFPCMLNVTDDAGAHGEAGAYYHVTVPQFKPSVMSRTPANWQLHIAQPNPAGVQHGWVHRTWDHGRQEFKTRKGARWERAATLQAEWNPKGTEQDSTGSKTIVDITVAQWCDYYRIPRPTLDEPLADEVTFSVDEKPKPGEPTLLERLQANQNFDMDALKLKPLGNGVQQVSVTTKDKDGKEFTHAINIYDDKISIVNDIVDGKAKMPDPAAIKKALELFVAAYGNDRTISVSNTDKAVESYVKAEIKKLIADPASGFSKLNVLEPVVSHDPAQQVNSANPNPPRHYP
jgi:hypothetical protein